MQPTDAEWFTDEDAAPFSTRFFFSTTSAASLECILLICWRWSFLVRKVLGQCVHLKEASAPVGCLRPQCSFSLLFFAKDLPQVGHEWGFCGGVEEGGSEDSSGRAEGRSINIMREWYSAGKLKLCWLPPYPPPPAPQPPSLPGDSSVYDS